jgi:glycosyltransferase involved in cell wall biosynthesis
METTVMSVAGVTPTPGGEAAAPIPPLLSVVAPCFNEADGLAELHRRVSAACADVVGDAYEIVLVDDGSSDATALILAELAHRDPHVVGVKLSRNYGHQLALTAGLSVCRGERTLIVDADLQDPPELLGAMMALMDEGADVVYGQRITRAGETWWKRATASLFYRVLRGLSAVEVPLDSGEFRLMNRRSLAALLAMPEAHRFLRGMVSWIGFKQVALPYERAGHFRGATKYPWRRMLRLASDGITGFSVRPLQLANYLSLLLVVCSLLVLGYAIFQWFQGATVPGWTSVMTVVLVLGSFQMLVLAIMCAYLGRLFMESKRRPLFLIDRIIRGDTVATMTAESMAPGETVFGGGPRPDDGRVPAPQRAGAERRRSST